jgi:hypothetical protein
VELVDILFFLWLCVQCDLDLADGDSMESMETPRGVVDSMECV